MAGLPNSLGACYSVGLLMLTAVFITTLFRKLRGEKCILNVFSAKATEPLRGIMALLIIATHVSFKYTQDHPCWGFTTFGAPIVSTFFFLSGYGLVVSYMKKGNRYLCGFPAKSSIKLLIPFLLASAAWITISVGLLGYSLYEELLGFVIFRPPLPYSWFIYALWLLYMSYYLVFRFANDGKTIRLVLMLITTLSITITFRMLDFGVYWYISLFAFNTGTFYGAYHRQINQILEIHPLTCQICLFGFLLLLMIFNIRTGTLTFIPIISLVTILYLGGASSCKPLVSLGSVSYEIYLLHGIFINLLSGHNLSWPVYLGITVILTTASAYLLKTLSIRIINLKICKQYL